MQFFIEFVNYFMSWFFQNVVLETAHSYSDYTTEHEEVASGSASAAAESGTG